MRESIGGAWLFGIVVTFVFLFAGFLTYSINYTRAFNTKNQIINYIEQAEGFTMSELALDNVDKDALSKDPSVQGKAYYLITTMGYDKDTAKDAKCPEIKDELGVTRKSNKMIGGYCVTKICHSGSGKSNTQYKVTAFVALRIPVVNIVVSIPISGETRTIYYDIGNLECS